MIVIPDPSIISSAAANISAVAAVPSSASLAVSTLPSTFMQLENNKKKPLQNNNESFIAAIKKDISSSQPPPIFVNISTAKDISFNNDVS